MASVRLWRERRAHERPDVEEIKRELDAARPSRTS
jgi:hypothetical protein